LKKTSVLLLFLFGTAFYLYARPAMEDDRSYRGREAPAEAAPAAPEPGAAAAAGPPPGTAAGAPPAAAVTPPVRPARPFVVFNEGVTASWLTRIIKQSGRSNFVFEDFLPGLYFGMELVNLKSVLPKFPLVPQLRLAAYYPLQSTFNDIPQPSKTPLHIGADALLGLGFKLDMFKYIRFNLVPAVHFFFLNSERWNYFNLGAAGILGMELPLTTGWTILINGIASFDNGNLGKNRDIEPFDIVYQYQVDVGVRFSKKARNEYPYIKPGLFGRIKNKLFSPRHKEPPPVSPEPAQTILPEPVQTVPPEPESAQTIPPEPELSPEPPAAAEPALPDIFFNR
jgi:hypothetical protein